MAWPFTGVTAPNFDSGFVTLPSSFTAVPSSPGGTSWLLGAHLNNSTSGTVTVSLKDGSGTLILQVDVPGGQVVTVEWPFIPASGTYTWMADTASTVVAKLWGYA